MKKKIVSLSLLTLVVCSFALATEYKSPEVGFKKYAAPSKEMKVADFGEHYKVEMGIEKSRQIASEEESERVPSSEVAKKDAKKLAPSPEFKEAPTEAPQPWLYRTNNDL